MKRLFPHILIIITLLFFVAAFFSCHKESDSKVTDPKKAIVGRWEIVDPPYWPGTSEKFLSEGNLISYNITDTTYSTYWLNDSILYKQHIYGIKGSNDTLVLTESYRFDFINFNKLRLNDQSNSLWPILIYKRIK